MNNLKIRDHLPRLRFIWWLSLTFCLVLIGSQLPRGSAAISRAFAEDQSTAAPAAIFSVTNGNDSGAGSLRQAILDANSSPGLDTIAFNLPDSNRTIRPFFNLPAITSPVLIDGTTQPGFAGVPIVEVRGIDPNPGGFNIQAPSTIRSLVINDFDFNGIFIGIAGSGSRVEGCYIGTDVTGTLAIPNGGAGIAISSSNNIIGGTTAATRNVISGNNGAGIAMTQPCCTGTNPNSANNVIQGNYIGTNAQGTAAIPNLSYGVTISGQPDTFATGNVIGGTVPGAGNVISGNKREGVSLGSFNTTGNFVQGNFIGTDATGSYAVSNGDDGVQIDVARNNVIGGSDPNARNVISANGFNGSGTGGGNGISITNASGNIVQGNAIGTNAAGTAPLANLLNGVAVSGTNNIIGGIAAGEGNVIAFNGLDGIVCADPAAAGHTFRGNSIFSNGSIMPGDNTRIGIDLGTSGVTANDAGDGDSGANTLQNFPVINLVNITPASVNVQGTLNSTAATTFTLDFYASSVCHAVGFGEGARRIGSGIVTTDAGGNGAFDLTFALSLPANQVVTATATSPTGNTSEFSACFAAAPAAGSLSFSVGTLFVSESAGQASFVVNRTGGTAGSIMVDYFVRGETAIAGSDFTATQGTLVFADGETSKSFTVPILDDTISEDFETALVSLSTTGNLDVLGSGSFATLRIVDDDPVPSLSINDVTVNEASSGTTNANFTVSLSKASGQTVSVFYSTAAGTATANDDYQTKSATVTFNPGETSKTVTILVIGDVLTEPNETFFVNLSSPNHATIADNQGQGTIIDVSVQVYVRFTADTFETTEGAGSTTIAVERGGDTSAAVTVDYFTAPDSLTPVPCAAFTNGKASPRCDFTPAVGTLRFAAGETSKTFAVLLSQDSYSEGLETLTISLASPTGGAFLANPAVTTLRIIDDSSEPNTNPIDEANNFVRQHYHDFLNREPDAAGLAFWSNQITECQQPGATCNADVRRINVSAAFFLSIEFQETGYLVERLYKSAYGDALGISNFGPTHQLAVPVIRFEEFLPDTQQIALGVVVGQPGYEQQLENNKIAFTQAFVARSRFTTAFPTTLTPTQFVDALFLNAGVTPAAAERASVIGEFGGAGNSADMPARARALRRVAENPAVAELEKNKAFVLMQYYGYLRRNPDQSPDSDYSGYDFWLTKLNQFNGNFVEAEMVKAFITSGEYRQRFGP